MTVPTDPQTLDVAFAGAPWVQVKPVGSTDVQTLDVAFAGAPFAFYPGDFITGTATATTAACAVAATGAETFTGTGTCDTVACACAGTGTVGGIVTATVVVEDIDAVGYVPRTDFPGWAKRAEKLTTFKTPEPEEKPAAPEPDVVPIEPDLPPFVAPAPKAKKPKQAAAAKPAAKPRKRRPMAINGRGQARTEPAACGGRASAIFRARGTGALKPMRCAGHGHVVLPRSEEEEILSLIALIDSMEMELA